MLKCNQIKKIHNNQTQDWQEGMVFATTARKSCKKEKEKNILKLNKIKEAHNIQAQSRQERMMFFYATTDRKKSFSLIK